MDFTGRTALVTGGASGIGREVVQQLSAKGAAVAVADINLQGAEAVARFGTPVQRHPTI